MPNYVTNKISMKANAQQLHEILTAIQRDGDVYGSFDFNKLIPMPESLNMTEGSITKEAVSAYASSLIREDPFMQKSGTKEDIQAALSISKSRFGGVTLHMSAKEIKELAEHHEMTEEVFCNLGKQYIDNQRAYGAATWYTWATENWGTKWNLQEGSLLNDQNELQFDTAWSAPVPILTALSARFPRVEFAHAWADEDLGYNVGRSTYLNGEIINSFIPEPGSAQAYELAAEILEIDLRDMSLRFDVKTGTYIYDESYNEPGKTPSLDNIIDFASAKTATAPEKGSAHKEPEPER